MDFGILLIFFFFNVNEFNREAIYTVRTHILKFVKVKENSRAIAVYHKLAPSRIGGFAYCAIALHLHHELRDCCAARIYHHVHVLKARSISTRLFFT